jgi:hypothetical protein
MDITLDIQKIQENLNITYLTNLIKACEKNNIVNDILQGKLDKLRESETKSETKSPKPILRNVSKNSLNTKGNPNTDSPTSNQFSDDYLYQKPWTKLTAIHKIIKIKEYTNSLLIKDESEKADLREKLVNLIKNKVLTKKESVLYDPVKSKIISIPSLQFKGGKYII